MTISISSSTYIGWVECHVGCVGVAEISQCEPQKPLSALTSQGADEIHRR